MTTRGVLEASVTPDPVHSLARQDGRTAAQWLSGRGALACGVATAAIVFLVLMLRQPYLFTTPMVAWGHDAVLGIEIVDAKHVRLFDGANSRIGTSHPGPALFYAAAPFEAVLYDWLGISPEPLNAHRIAYAALSTAFFGVVIMLFARRARLVETVVAVCMLTGMMAVLPYVFASSWTPHIYCIPFMLSIASAGALLSGDRRALLPYTISSWFLVHGHVAFIGNVGGMTAFILAVFLWRHRHEIPDFVRRNLRLLLPSAWASLVFLLPLVVNLFVNWPQPWRGYYDFMKTAPSDPRGLGDVWSFVAYFLTWKSQIPGWIAVALAACSLGIVASLPRGDLRRFLFWILVACGAGLALFTAYAALGVDRLNEKYIGYYAFGLPALIVAAAAVAFCRRFPRLAPVALTASIALFLGVAVSADAFITVDRGHPEVAEIAESLRSNPERGGRLVALTFEHSSWPFAVAMMQHGSHHGLPVCVADASWTSFVTKRFICRPDQVDAGWRLHMSPIGMPASGPPVLRTTNALVTASR
jgi:hypothetical protein